MNFFDLVDKRRSVRKFSNERIPEAVITKALKAALLAQKSGADSITIHLREDRRHIKERDLYEIKNKLKIPLNLEMAPTSNMLKITLKYKPDYACIVPEKRKEITTEGGLNLKKNTNLIKRIVNKLKQKGISKNQIHKTMKENILSH